MKKFKKALVGVIVGVFLIGSLNGCGNSSSSSVSEKTSSDTLSSDDVTIVRAVGSTSYYPLVYQNDDGELEGYAIDVNNAVDELLEDYEWQYEASSGDAILMGLEQGVYDEAIGGYYYTKERAEKFTFPVYDGGSIAIIVTTKEHDDVKAFSDAIDQKLKVAPTLAGGGLIAFFKQYNETHSDSQVEYDTIDERSDYDIYLDVANGKYDYDVTNLHQYKKVLDDNPDSDIAKKTVYNSFAAIKAFDLFNNKQQKLVEDYNAAIETLYENGTLSEIYKKWFGEDIFETLKTTDDEDYGIVFIEK